MQNLRKLRKRGEIIEGGQTQELDRPDAGPAEIVEGEIGGGEACEGNETVEGSENISGSDTRGGSTAEETYEGVQKFGETGGMTENEKDSILAGEDTDEYENFEEIGEVTDNAKKTGEVYEAYEGGVSDETGETEEVIEHNENSDAGGEKWEEVASGGGEIWESAPSNPAAETYEYDGSGEIWESESNHAGDYTEEEKDDIRNEKPFKGGASVANEETGCDEVQFLDIGAEQVQVEYDYDLIYNHTGAYAVEDLIKDFDVAIAQYLQAKLNLQCHVESHRGLQSGLTKRTLLIGGIYWVSTGDGAIDLVTGACTSRPGESAPNDSLYCKPIKGTLNVFYNDTLLTGAEAKDELRYAIQDGMNSGEMDTKAGSWTVYVDNRPSFPTVFAGATDGTNEINTNHLPFITVVLLAAAAVVAALNIVVAGILLTNRRRKSCSRT